MRTIALLMEILGALLIVGGVAAFSIPIACIVFGALLLAAGEVHG